MCSRPSSRRIDDGPVTGSMTCRGSPTLNCAGFHLNTCSTRSRSATWTSSPMITSFVRKTRPYRSRIAIRVSSGRMTPRTVCARRGRRGPGTSEEDLMRAELTRARGRRDPSDMRPARTHRARLRTAADVDPLTGRSDLKIPRRRETMNRTMITAAVAAAATVALPAPGVLAKPGSHESHAPKGRCAKLQSVGFAAAGSLASYTTDTVTVNVTRANKHARAYIAAAGQTFSLSGARLSFHGVTD